MMLEFSQYLENYLWPNFEKTTSSRAHVMSIVVMLNEKFRERVEVWKMFKNDSEKFENFFHQVLEMILKNENELTASDLREQIALLIFLNHCFNSMEVEICRNEAKKLVSLSMWSSLQPSKF